MTVEESTWRVGRFAFELPDTFDLVRRNQDIYYVDVSTVTVPEGETVESVWAHNLAQIIQKTPGGSDAIEQFELAPDFPAAYYHVDADHDVITLEAHKQFRNYSLALRIEGKAEKKADMEKLFGIVANAFLAGESRGFWVGYGSVTSTPGNTEQAKIRLRDDALKIEISVQTRAVVQVEEEDPLIDIKEEIEILRLDGVDAELLLDRPRSVAGITGREIHLSSASDGETILRFRWSFAGMAMEPLRPQLRFDATASAESRQKLLAIWETLLSSFRQVQ